MQIQDLTRDASLNFLKSRHLGRIACADHSQPYVTPCNFVYHDHCIYSFGTIGQKIDWLRRNPLACLLVDEIVSSAEWTSIVVFGRYDELANESNRDSAHHFLSKYPEWWQPGYTKTIIHGVPRQLEPVFFRMSIDEITGRTARLSDD